MKVELLNEKFTIKPKIELKTLLKVLYISCSFTVMFTAFIAAHNLSA